jgi:hypothetical protein
MRINPFFILLYLLVFIPQILGVLYLPFKITVILTNIFLILTFFYKAFAKKKLIKYSFLGITLTFIVIQWIKNFSIGNLPYLLFLLSDWFILFLSLQSNSFRKFLYISLLSFLNMALISVGFNTISYGLILLFFLFLEEYFFLLLTAEGYKNTDVKLFKSLFKYASLSYVLIFSLGVVFFFLLPRPQYPLFALLQRDTGNPVVGFSSDIKLGAFSKIATDDSVVFRAKISDFSLNKNPYWRGNTLEIFLNNAWYSSTIPYQSDIKLEGKVYKEEMLISPYGGQNIFSLGYPYKILKSSSEVEINPTRGVILTKRYITSPLKISFIALSIQRGKLTDKKLLLKYPRELKPIFDNIARKYSLKGKSFSWVLKGVSNFFSNFKYSLNNKAKTLEEFLTIYREGNCEYFASTAALLFRYLGYPTRVVVGFYGGEYNPITKYWVVRQKDAHAWIEIYYNEKWIPFDATSYAIVEVSKEEKEKMKKNNLLLIWDTLNTYWLEYVVNLNREKQKDLLTGIVKRIKNLHFEWNFHTNLTYIGLVLSILFPFLLKRFLIFSYTLWLSVRYRISFKIFKNFTEIYTFLWRYYPNIWEREKQKLKIFIRLKI